jgi:hypothetical protein
MWLQSTVSVHRAAWSSGAVSGRLGTLWGLADATLRPNQSGNRKPAHLRLGLNLLGAVWARLCRGRLTLALKRPPPCDCEPGEDNPDNGHDGSEVIEVAVACDEDDGDADHRHDRADDRSVPAGLLSDPVEAVKPPVDHSVEHDEIIARRNFVALNVHDVADKATSTAAATARA